MARLNYGRKFPYYAQEIPAVHKFGRAHKMSFISLGRYHYDSEDTRAQVENKLAEPRTSDQEGGQVCQQNDSCDWVGGACEETGPLWDTFLWYYHVQQCTQGPGESTISSKNTAPRLDESIIFQEHKHGAATCVAGHVCQQTDSCDWVGACETLHNALI